MTAARLRPVQLARLVAHELWHERWLSLCSACVLAATLSPLWTLWGLEHGVIGTLIERQNRDPVMRQVLPESTGAHRFDADWFAEAARWPEVSFVIPSTRSIANQVDLLVEASGRAVRLDLLPTSRGDPLLGAAAPPPAGALLLSARAAERLAASAGDALTVAVERTRDGRTEHAAIAMRVAAVLPVQAYDGTVALAPLPLLEGIQAWRDGYAVPALGGDGRAPAPRTTTYPLFRMYAADIREVEPLARRLEAKGVAVYTRAREIAGTLGLQRNLRAVLAMVTAIATSGAVVALVAMQAATLRRKRRDYALLKLVGHGRSWLVLLPCLHALAVAALGAAIAWGIYVGAAAAIDAYFAQHLGSGESAVRLRAVDLAWGFAAAASAATLPALWGGWRASNVEAADELREV